MDSDQISFIQPDSGVNENLLSQQSQEFRDQFEARKEQILHFDRIKQILNANFGIIFSKFDEDQQSDESLQSKITAKYIVEGLDPIALNCL